MFVVRSVSSKIINMEANPRNLLGCILLVDDDEATNFLNEDLLGDLAIAEHIAVVWNGQRALDYLLACLAGEPKHTRPDIIILDINMPLMDGFEFLKEYQELPPEFRVLITVVLLSTSSQFEDTSRATDSKIIEHLIEKPLKEEDVWWLVAHHLERTSM